MKIRYNFGLIKQLDIGFSSNNGMEKFHNTLREVRKNKNFYRFIYENDYYVEIDEKVFSNCKFIKEDNTYWFVCQSEPVCSSLFLFTMYDTYGFPLELSIEECKMNNIIPDENGFYLLKQIQKDKNKDSFKNKNAFE